MENYASRKQKCLRRKGDGMVQAPQERGRIHWDVLPETAQSCQVGGKGKKEQESKALETRQIKIGIELLNFQFLFQLIKFAVKVCAKRQPQSRFMHQLWPFRCTS
eukprot:4181982-Ditylum_brightwellii.AAC.1